MLIELSRSCPRFAAILAIAIVLACLPVSQAVAQTTSGTLVGTVYKPTGEPLGGARVTATNELNGNARSTITSPDGSYRIPFMPPGRYTINASMEGFTDNKITGFPIPLNSTTNLVPPITLGAVGGPTPTPTGASTSARTEGESRVSLVNTNDPTRRGNFAKEQLNSLPLGGTSDTRSFDELATLVPGVAPPPYVPGVRGPGVGYGIGTAGQFSVNGARARANNFTVDGSDNNDPDVGVRRQGFVALIPQSIESVQEFQISTLLWDAEAGRNVGSQVNAVSISGANQYHGTLYGFFNDSALNARNAYDFTGGASGGEDPYTRLQAGFVFGGPIRKDKTQFFTSYERQEVNGSVEQHFSTPTFDQRRFLGLPQFAVLKPIPDPAFNMVGFLTSAGSTPIGTNVLSLYPLPNNPQGPYGLNDYTQILPSSGDGNVFSFKVTNSFNENNVLNARYNFTKDNRILPSVNQAINSTINSDTTTNNISVIFDTAFSPTLFNQARFSYGRTVLNFPEYPSTSPFIFEKSSVVGIDTPDGTIGFESRTFPIGELIIDPYSPVGVDVFTFPQGRTNNTYQFADSVSWTKGNHALKFGADIRYEQLNSFQDRNYRPLVIFANGVQAFGFLTSTGNPAVPFGFQDLSPVLPLLGVQLAAFGAPSSLSQVITSGVPDSSIKLRTTEYDFFINDSWRIKPNFTLDMGLRYEYNSVPSDATGSIEAGLDTSNIPVAGNSAIDDPVANFFYENAVSSYEHFLDGRTSIYDGDANNFGPHIGFAWDPWGDGRTAIRGGYGVYFDSILGAVVSQSRNVFPNETAINVDTSFLGTNILDLPNPATLAIRPRGTDQVYPLILPGTVNQFGSAYPSDFPALIGTLFAQNYRIGGLAFTLPTRELATPYVQQWHLTLEHQFLTDYVVSAAYVGTKGTKLLRMTTPNLGPNVTPFLPIAVAAPNTPYTQGPPLVIADIIQSLIATRPYPFLGAFQQFEDTAASSYHALQLEASKRYSNGYTFTAAYTYSHAIDDVSDVFPIAGAPVLPEDSFNLRLERGNANYDVQHRFALSAVWDLPLYRDSTSSDIGSKEWFLGNFQLSTIYRTNTGQPFTLNMPFDSNVDGNRSDRPLTTEGLTFVDNHGPTRVIQDPNAPVSNFVQNQYGFGPDGQIFFLGSDGAVGRNTVRADGWNTWDLALSKTFVFGENSRLDFRAEFFNILNRTNYGIPVRTLYAPGFGSSTDTATPARFIQFALKYSF